MLNPPAPWQERVVVSAAGIIASGWTAESKVFLLSSDGYSISDPLTGERLIRNRDEDDTAMKKFSQDNLAFEIEELSQTIKVFGLRGGDGNHASSDGWYLDTIHPEIGQQIVGISHFSWRRFDEVFWKNIDLIQLERLEHTQLKYGFSPCEKFFGIFGSAGAEIFNRK